MSSLGLVLSPRSDPRDVEIDRLRRENEQMRAALDSANYEIAQSRQLHSAQAEAVQNIRSILEPLFHGLQRVFREMERGGFETYSAPKNNAIWEDWKRKLGGHTAKAIDVLLMHGQLNRTQLRIHLSCATGTVTNVVAALNKAGLIDKSGDGISLKEL